MATISDVAKKAGVSIATVSYVLNGRIDLVREETAERIRKAAAELKYSASPMARGLATGSSYTVAVVLPDHYVFSHPIGSQEFLGVAEEFYMSNYSLLIKPSYMDERRMQRPHRGLPKHVAGVLVLGPMNLDNPDLLEARDLNKPMVVLEDIPDDWGITRVNADNHKAATMITDYLLDHGHTSIGIISHTSVSPCMERRLNGFTSSLRARGLEPNTALQFDIDSIDIDEISQAAEELIDSPLKPTAIIALNSALIPGIAQAIANKGIRVPEDIEIGCVDYGMPPNFRLNWPIVSLSLDLRCQGELAARTLIDMLKNKTTSESKLIAPELVVLQP